MANVNTKTVTDRRALRFDTPAQMRAEIDRLVAAERAGKLRRVGNWTLGQNLGHLAAWASYPFDGYPLKNPPAIIRLIVKLRKDKYINGAMPPGVRIPGIPAGTMSTEELTTDEGLARIHAAWARLETTAPTVPNPLFGPLTHDEWKNMNLRHAELHLGFLHPEMMI